MLQLVGAPIPKTAEQTVSVLEKMLERAKTGELIQVAVTYVTDDGCTGHGYGAASGEHMATLLGALELMRVAIVDEINHLG